MQIDITGHNIEVSGALRAYFEKRTRHVEKLAQPPLSHLHVVLSMVKNIYRCDIQSSSGENNFVCKSEEADMYVAIDRAADKITRQITGNKGRKLARRHAR